MSFESGVESVPLEMLLSRKRRDLKEVAEGKALGSLGNGRNGWDGHKEWVGWSQGTSAVVTRDGWDGRRLHRDSERVILNTNCCGCLDETPSNLQSSPSEVENDVQVITNELPLERSIAKHSRESISLKEALDEEEDDTIK